MMDNEQRFIRFLRDRIGLDVASVGAALIERAVAQRVQTACAVDLDAYWTLLQGSAAEQQGLIEAVIVPETWFMRYPESFAALCSVAKGRLAHHQGRTLRILSLPCSTGEEPYSIAMALLDAGLAPEQFSVDGVDVSPLSVEKARRGVYGRNSFRGASLAFRDRHFTSTLDGYLLNADVREQVRLQVGNVLDPMLLRGEAPYDFVFCRNLLIYFDLPTQQQAFEALKKWVQQDGALFIGPAEGSLLARMGMRPIGIAQSFAFVRETDKPPAPVAPVATRLQSPVRLLPQNQPPLPRTPRPTAPVAMLGKPESQTTQSDSASLLAQIASLANEGKSADAQAACEAFLRSHGPDPQVFYWLGLLSDVGGQALQAQGYYRKALYLDPQHAEALAHLAMLLAAQGDVAGARRLQERAARSDRPAGREHSR
jgi:chemotaxis protein methyltransferase WspC